MFCRKKHYTTLNFDFLFFWFTCIISSNSYIATVSLSGFNLFCVIETDKFGILFGYAAASAAACTFVFIKHYLWF